MTKKDRLSCDYEELTARGKKSDFASLLEIADIDLDSRPTDINPYTVSTLTHSFPRRRIRKPRKSASVCQEGPTPNFRLRTKSESDSQTDQAIPLVGFATRSGASKVEATRPISDIGQISETGPILCPYWSTCERYLKSLQLQEVYFDHKFDKCFCDDCVRARDDNPHCKRGVPLQLYSRPTGWCRFGLSCEAPAVKAMGALGIWHVAFHGTTQKNVLAILESQSLLMPGDVNIDGNLPSPPTGHYNEDWKPEGFDCKQIFLSPTMAYAGLPVYAKPQSWTDPTTGKQRDMQVAFQVCIKPDSYNIGAATVALRDRRLDDAFENSELEWSTKVRGGTVLTGILIKPLM